MSITLNPPQGEVVVPDRDEWSGDDPDKHRAEHRVFSEPSAKGSHTRMVAVAYTDVERRPIFNPSYIICGVFGLYTHFPLHTPYPILPRPAGPRRRRGDPLLDAHQVAQVLERDCPPQCQHRSRAVAYTDVERRPIFNPSYIICGVFVYGDVPLDTRNHLC